MQRVTRVLVPLLIFIASSVAAENRFLIRVDSQSVSDESCEQLLERLGFEIISNVAAGDSNLYIVSSSDQLSLTAVQEMLDTESRIHEVEFVRELLLPAASRGDESGDLPERARTFAEKQEDADRDGRSAFEKYWGQVLTRRLKLGSVHRQLGGGQGIVAVIDTGVDPDHPALSGSLVPGYDFILDEEGYASEWLELDPDLTAELSQSTVAVLDQSTVAVLDQSTVAVLDQFAFLHQSTVAVLDSELAERLASNAFRAFGHGTLVAGLVHRVAPDAGIMPLKAFRADGTSSTEDIVAAIYYAVQNGADVINMSFSFQAFSPEVMRAVNFATRSGVVCVSAAGNLGEAMLVYPASLANVIGVAATTAMRERSMISNFGEDLVSVATLGEEVLTTYPGGRYASVYGTSFSTAIVAGSMALLRELNGDIDQYTAEAALAMGRDRNGELGHGELNLPGAVIWLRENRSRDDDDGSDD